MSWRFSSGLQAWLLQRLSAIYMSAFLVYLAYFLVANSPLSYQLWYEWILSPFTHVFFVLFFLALITHAWVGARDIILDYVKPFALKLALLSIVMLLCIALGIWAFFVINRVAV